MHPALPSKLYKYRSLAGDSFRYTQDIFVHNEVYFSPLENLNDPAEGQHEYGFTLRAAPPTLMNPDYRPWGADLGARRVARTWGVLSMSAVADDVVMWSHYANGHRGICIEFDTATSFPDALPVNYATNLPKIDDDALASDEALARAMCLTKASQWQYEREWRTLRPHIGVIGFTAEAISAVILGTRTTERDARTVNLWLSTHSPRARLQRAVLESGSFRMQVSSHV